MTVGSRPALRYTQDLPTGQLTAFLEAILLKARLRLADQTARSHHEKLDYMENASVTKDAVDAHMAAAPRRVTAAVLTISDTRTPETDASGNYLAQSLEAAGHRVFKRQLVKDDAEAIRAAFTELLASEAQVVLSTGGTGIAGRDVTVPVAESLITKPLPGFGELFRLLSYREVGGAAMLSRAVGGLAAGGLIFALPGSRNAVQTAWEGLLKEQLGHLVYEVFRQGQPDAP